MTTTDPRTALTPTDAEHYLARLLITASMPHLRDHALDALEPDQFAHAALGGLWQAGRTLRSRNQPITRRGLIRAADSHQVEHTLDRLGDAVPHPGEYEAHVTEVTRCAALRGLWEATDRIRQRALTAEDPSQALAAAHEELSALDTDAVPDSARGYRDLLAEFATSMETGSSGGYRIVATPWGELNTILSGGLHGGRLYVIGARPGDGKSMTAHQLAEHAASQGHPAIVFSVEMDTLDVTGRMIANGATIELGEITRRELSRDAWHRFHAYSEQAAAYPLVIDDRANLTLDYIRGVCRAQKRRTGLAVICVDYLQLLSTDRRLSREQQIAEISRGLKQLAAELGAAVVVPAQLNRRAMDRNTPTIGDLRESGAIEQDADVVLLLAREVFPEGSDQAGKRSPWVTVNVAKNRHGREDTLELVWRGHYARIG